MEKYSPTRPSEILLITALYQWPLIKQRLQTYKKLQITKKIRFQFSINVTYIIILIPGCTCMSSTSRSFAEQDLLNLSEQHLLNLSQQALFNLLEQSLLNLSEQSLFDLLEQGLLNLTSNLVEYMRLVPVYSAVVFLSPML